MKIDWYEPGTFAEPKPLRTVFKTATCRQKKLLVRWLCGNVFTGARTDGDKGICPACGEVDTAVHRVRSCWVSVDHEFNFKKVEPWITGRSYVPVFTWKETRSNKTRLEYYRDGVPADPFYFNIEDGDIFRKAQCQIFLSGRAIPWGRRLISPAQAS